MAKYCSCGAVMGDELNFCTACGRKLEAAPKAVPEIKEEEGNAVSSGCEALAPSDNRVTYSSNYDVTYNVDMVFCIDTTGSMRPVLDLVKQNALNFYQDVMKRMDSKGKTISSLRVRVIAFKDYLAGVEDGTKPMLITDFFELPSKNEAFHSCINSLSPEGGGDIPEDGLEALAYAIRTDWNTGGMKKRQVIVVWTDAPTHEIGFGKDAPGYPENMARSFSELTEWWGDEQIPGYMNPSAKRLLLFAPDAKYWSTISDTWDNVIHFPSQAGKGLEELDYSQIIDTISNTI